MEPFLDLVDEVRLLHHRLVRVAEEIHAGGDVTVPQRAVLEFLVRNGPTSVPAIARARDVSRQHIQASVDALIRGGLVVARANPAHRRSPLVGLTLDGRRAITAMQRRERRAAKARLDGVDPANMQHAATVLAAVRLALDDRSER